jgi:UDP-MurNAc hydroxylase
VEITYLGHAGFLVETESAVVVMDPWLSPEGAFDSAWFQLPCNHHLAPLVREKLGDSSKTRYVYVSHEHRDHFDPDFLQTLPQNGLQFVLPGFHRTALRDEIAKRHSGNVLVGAHGQEITIPGGSLKLYIDDSGLNRDSAILVKADGQSFLNLNDCKLYDEVRLIADAEGPISVFACQFSGATWHPTCYDYDLHEYARISRQKQLSKFEVVARMIDAIRPGAYLPSAGPACFLDPGLLHLNFEAVNIFPRAPKLQEYLRQRLPDCPARFDEMMPGDVLAVGNENSEPRGRERVTEENFEAYIRCYAERYRSYFAERQPGQSAEQVEEIFEQLRTELGRKLSAFSMHKRILLPLYFGLTNMAGRMLRIDFPNKKIGMVSKMSESDYYSIQVPPWQMERVLAGFITWEELALTFRVRLNRKPDVYQTLVQGFLLMEPEDMDWFCRRFAGIEQKQNRVVIEAGGTRYSIDRLCPHQGGDLTQGWLQEGRLWTCPRHGWKFALEKDGRCLTSNATINAICLEND